MADFKNEMSKPNVRSLSVTSYNIHKSIGRDFHRDAQHIARIIDHLDADVVGLQEVRSLVGEGEDSHQVDGLSRPRYRI